MSKPNTPNTPFDEDDERIVRSSATEERGARGIDEDVARQDAGGLMSEKDYLALVQAEFEQVSLPKPPTIPGWHLCWLTTTSQYDTIPKRLRLGYKLVTTSEVQGFDPSNGQFLEKYPGYVTCNEMILGKIPDAYYQRMMKHFHHDEPTGMAKTALDRIKQGLDKEKDSEGNDLGEILGDGYLDMEKSAKRSDRTPRFNP
jgi:hypothetical protein